MRLRLNLDGRRGAFRLRAKGEYDIAGVTALFGPNGAGKSSVLQAIAGFRPEAGLVEIDGAVWQGGDARPVPPHRRPVGMVFQDSRLFEHLSVRGNLDYAARRADPDGAEIDPADVYDALELEPLLARRPQTLSGGEVQRVAIGRALLTRPRLLLMDEPLAALDRRRKANLLGVVAELPERFGAPVIFVSHLIEEIAQVSSRVIVLRDGEIGGAGPTAEMLEQFDVALTGRFEAGSLLEGEIVGIDERHALSIVDIGAARLVLPGARMFGVGDRVRLRLRARDVSVALKPVEGVSIRNQVRAVIAAIEMEPGAHAELTLDCGGKTIAARITRQAVDELGLRTGLEVYALVKAVAFDRRFR